MRRAALPARSSDRSAKVRQNVPVRALWRYRGPSDFRWPRQRRLRRSPRVVIIIQLEEMNASKFDGQTYACHRDFSKTTADQPVKLQ